MFPKIASWIWFIQKDSKIFWVGNTSLIKSFFLDSHPTKLEIKLEHYKTLPKIASWIIAVNFIHSKIQRYVATSQIIL